MPGNATKCAESPLANWVGVNKLPSIADICHCNRCGDMSLCIPTEIAGNICFDCHSKIGDVISRAVNTVESLLQVEAEVIEERLKAQVEKELKEIEDDFAWRS